MLMMINVYNVRDLHLFLHKKIIKGCGHCLHTFEEDDYAYAYETGTCQYCHKRISVGIGNEDLVIVANSQEELDKIPSTFKGIVYINFGTEQNPAIVYKTYELPWRVINESWVHAYNKSHIMAYNKSNIRATNTAYIEAYDESTVLAYDKVFVKAHDKSAAFTYNESCVRAYDKSVVRSHDISIVIACNETVDAFDSSNVMSYIASVIRANDNVTVIAKEKSTVYLYDTSRVEAYDDSEIAVVGTCSVKAYDNSYIRMVNYHTGTCVSANDMSTVVMDSHNKVPVVLNDKARLIETPKDIYEFINLHKIQCNNIQSENPTAIFYILIDENDSSIEFKPGSLGNYLYNEDGISVLSSKAVLSNFTGIHDVSHIKIIECEVELDEIIGFNKEKGVAMTHRLTMMKECSLKDFGNYGNLLDRLRYKVGE